MDELKDFLESSTVHGLFHISSANQTIHKDRSHKHIRIIDFALIPNAKFVLDYQSHKFWLHTNSLKPFPLSLFQFFPFFGFKFPGLRKMSCLFLDFIYAKS